MLRMRLACVLAVTAVFAVVQGCATQTSSPSPDSLAGGKDPGSSASGDDDDSKAAGDDDTGATPPATPAPTTTGTTPVTPPAPTKSKMTFFVSSTPAGTGATTSGNLGGLTGADTVCQNLATAVQGGDHTWHAYLSIGGTTPTNAKDRIGPGPWQNQKGTVIATDVASLHTMGLALSPNALDEKGNPVPLTGRYVLTGSTAAGTPSGNDCAGWTNNTNQKNATFGDTAFDPNANPSIAASWNYAYGVFPNNKLNCSTQGITAQKNADGRIYCFATN